MVYRDDEEAAFARADALQHELDLTRKELQESDAESEQLRSERDEADKRAKAASKRAKKLERDSSGEASRAGAALALAALAGGVMYVVSSRSGGRQPDTPAPSAVEPAAPAPPISAQQRESEAEAEAELRRKELALGLEAKVAFSQDCLNHADQELALLWRSYDPAATFGELRKPLWGIFVDFHLQYCVEAVGHAAAMEPALSGVDEAATAYAASLSQLLPLASKTYLYYDQRDYEDDGYAWVRGTFTELRGQLSRAITAAVTLRELFGPTIREHDATLLARLDHEDNRQGYLLTKVRRDAREIAAYLLEPKAELSRLEELVDRLDESAEAFGSELLADNSPRPDLKKSFDAAQNLIKHLKLLRRAAKANKADLRDPALLRNHYDVVSEFVVFDLSTTY